VIFPKIIFSDFQQRKIVARLSANSIESKALNICHQVRNETQIKDAHEGKHDQNKKIRILQVFFSLFGPLLS
jgi:hypothetical protein